MEALDFVDSLLFSLSRAFCTPIAVFIQIQVCLLFFRFQSDLVYEIRRDVCGHKWNSFLAVSLVPD